MTNIIARSAALALASGLAALPLAAADATVTYTSLLEYYDHGGITKNATPFGVVTLEEIDANDVKVTVTLNSPLFGFLNTGGPHDPFLFNLTGNYGVTISNNASQTFYNGGYSATATSTQWTATPFGDFTNRIGCCGDANGSGSASPPPLVFTVHDAAGITFAGIGATFSGTGQLLTLGTGDHFLSNDGGWWFAADVTDGRNTFNIAARDAYTTLTTTPGVPEPATWLMMVGGFGLTGAALRARKRRTTVSFA